MTDIMGTAMNVLTEGFLQILSLSMVGSYIVLLVLLARILLRKSPRWCSYLLWGLVFIRLILPIFPESAFSLIPAGLQYNMEETWQINEDTPDIETILVDHTNKIVISGMDEQDVVGTHEVSPVPQNQEIPQNVIGQEAAGNEVVDQTVSLRNIIGILSVVWMAGTVIFGGYHIWSYWKLKQQVKGTVLGADGVYEMKGEHLSFVLGIIRPAIYLSGELDAESRKVVLCHEQIHLKRRDYLIKPAALAVACVHWFNPFVWLAFYLMSRDCEISCDEKVIAVLGENSKKIYSYTLLNEATNGQMQYKKRNTCAVLSFGEDGIKGRIKHVLQFKKAPVWLLICTGLLLVLLVLGICSNSNSEVSETQNQEEIHQNTSGEHDEIPTNMVEDMEEETNTGGNEKAEASSGVEVQNSEGNDEAVLSYWAVNQKPEIYPVYETVELEEKDGQYYVKGKTLVEYDRIDNLEQFEAAYGLDYGKAKEIGVTYDLATHKKTGYSKAFVRTIMQHIFYETNPDYYNAYKDPVTAAKILLHLGEGSGEVTEYLHEALPRRLWSSGFGEGSVVLVSYTFAEDQSMIQVPMVLVEESLGIWGLSTGDLTGRDTTEGVLPNDTYMNKANRETVTDNQGNQYEFSDLGICALNIYGEDVSDYRCIYPYFLPRPTVIWLWEDILYFPASSQYSDAANSYTGDVDWMYDCLCALDMNTGVYQYVSLPQEILSQGVWKSLYVHDGFAFINGGNGIPLADAKAVWEGKAVFELSEDEKDAYGSYLREYILTQPETVLRIGNRSLEETVAVIDMDGDGNAEEITIVPDLEEQSHRYFPYDFYDLYVDDYVEKDRWASRLNNEIWAFSPDGEEVYLALYEDGASGDPRTTILSYEDGKLVEAGSINKEIEKIQISGAW